MAPILSKIVKVKTGPKIPRSESNVRAIATLLRKTTPKTPTKYFPRPGEDRELEELLAQCPRPADTDNQEPPETPNPTPNSDSNQPGPSHHDENPPESIFVDGLDPVLEPNMSLKDITEAQRAQILMYPGSDKTKRRCFFMENYMDYYRYYEIYDCWNECFITSKFTLTFCSNRLTLDTFNSFCDFKNNSFCFLKCIFSLCHKKMATKVKRIW